MTDRLCQLNTGLCIFTTLYTEYSQIQSNSKIKDGGWTLFSTVVPDRQFLIQGPRVQALGPVGIPPMRGCSWAATGKLRNRLPCWPIRNHKEGPPPLICPLFGNYGALVAASALSCLNMRGPPPSLKRSDFLSSFSFSSSSSSLHLLLLQPLLLLSLPWVRIPHSFCWSLLSLLLPVILFILTTLTLSLTYPCVPGSFSAVITYPSEPFDIHLLTSLPVYTKNNAAQELLHLVHSVDRWFHRRPSSRPRTPSRPH